MQRVLWRAVVLIGLSVSSCAGAPRPKAPNETGRTPVNRVVPPEVQGRRGGAPTP